MAGSSSNYISRFAPQSHFFTDPAAITQSAAQAFGPIAADGSPAEAFHVTSSFTVAADTRAFAICTGVVLVQPQTGSDSLVNLILRPFKQPISGLNIKYFIYRGLKKADFFSGNLVLPGTSGNSDFINKINSAFEAFYANGTKPDFLAAYIGFDPANQPDNMPIANLFFKQSTYTTNNGQSTETPQTAFELPLIASGASLGNFASGECGIDIVLNYGDYQLPTPNDEFVFDLAYARDNDYNIDLSGISDDFKRKLIKEQIFQFLDAAAYFGFHSTEQGVVTIDNNGTKVKKTGNAIYTDVIQHFQTRNNLYLYIQSDRTRSYNFYGNYNISDSDINCLKMGLTADTLTERTYDTNGWPLLVYNTPQNTSDATSSLYLQFVTDNNDNVVLYGQVAQIGNIGSNNFCGPDDLRLADNADGTTNNFTATIALSNPVTGPDGAKLIIATFNILIYQGIKYIYTSGQSTDDQGQPTDTLAQPNFCDDIFDLITASPIFSGASNAAYSAVISQKIKLLNHYFDKIQYGVSSVQTTVINDQLSTTNPDNPTLNRVIYLSETIDVLSAVISAISAITNDTQSGPAAYGSVTSNNTYSLPDPFYYTKVDFTDDNQDIIGLKIGARDGTTPNKLLLGLTKAENDSIKALITNELTNPRLFMVNRFDDGAEFTSPEGVSYRSYKIAVLAENGEDLKILTPTEDVVIYSLDSNYYFSPGYSAYMPDLIYTTDYFTVNTVI